MTEFISFNISSFHITLASFIVDDKNKVSGVATIAPWFFLCLPSYSRGFESKAHHLSFFNFELLKL